MPSLDEIVGGAAPAGAAGSSDEEIVLDFTEALASGDYEVGRWPAVVKECYAGTSNEGNPKLVWEFEFTDGPNKGRVMKRSTPTTGKGSGISRQTIKALGFETEGEKVNFRPSAAKGRACEVEVRQQKNNTDFQEISRVYPAK